MYSGGKLSNINKKLDFDEALVLLQGIGERLYLIGEQMDDDPEFRRKIMEYANRHTEMLNTMAEKKENFTINDFKKEFGLNYGFYALRNHTGALYFGRLADEDDKTIHVEYPKESLN